jgi:MFS family permease
LSCSVLGKKLFMQSKQNRDVDSYSATKNDVLEKAQVTGTGIPQNIETIPAARARKVRLPAAFSSLRHRNYQLWFGGQLVSVVGTWMQIIAQGWLVYEISHSEFALGLVSFASAVPLLFVSPYGGVITDRVPKRTLLIITQSTAMTLAFVLSVLAFTKTVQVWHIVALAVVLGIVNAFDAPARQALVVEMVGREDLPNAIALNSMMFNGARVIGPAVGGLLLALLGSAWCFFINGMSFLAVIAGLLAMRFPPMKLRTSSEHPLRQFAQGVAYARSQRDILTLLVLSAVFSVCGTAYTAILPAFIDQSLHSDATGYGTINAAVGAGAVLGALLIAQFGPAWKRGKTLVLASLVYPFILAVFAFNTQFPLAVFLSFLLGMGFMMLFNNANSLLQIRVSDEMRGRIMSLYTLSFFGFAPFGTLAIGLIAEKVPLGLTIGLSAGLTLLSTLLIYAWSQEIWKLE